MDLNIRKPLGVLLAACLTFSLCSCGASASGVSLKPALVKSVTVYAIDYETKEWIPAEIIEYTYENGYPVLRDHYDYNADHHTITTFEYKFEDGVPVEMKQYDGNGTLVRTTAYKDGKVYEYNEVTENGNRTTRVMLQYGNQDAYFTQLLSASHFEASEEGEYTFDMEETDSISITTKNGLLVKTVNTGLYANWNKGDEKKWERFNGTYTANYDGNGILSSTSSVFRAGPPGAEDLFSLTVKDGKITDVVRDLRYQDQDPQHDRKFVFEYCDDVIDAARYASMINEHIRDTGNYYYYFWY